VLEKYVAGSPLQSTVVSHASAFEECFFLGLRLNRGVDLREVSAIFGRQVVNHVSPAICELINDGLLQRDADCIRLTPRGRLLSNEVFQSFLAPRISSNSI
jgi:oxygen-independent coproporphyrinogen-3 oxidase